jgi:hypothetical protein
MTASIYCWGCYGLNEAARGRCRWCGQPIEEPPGTSFVDRLVWALHHPLHDRRILAAKALGERREAGARGALRTVIDEGDDPYLAAEALRSLLLIDGAAAHRDLVERLSGQGSVPVRAVARRALEELRAGTSA